MATPQTAVLVRARKVLSSVAGESYPLLQKLRKNNPNRWPAGAPGGQGGEFAPKEGGGGGGSGGGARDQFPFVKSNKQREVQSKLEEAIKVANSMRRGGTPNNDPDLQEVQEEINNLQTRARTLEQMRTSAMELRLEEEATARRKAQSGGYPGDEARRAQFDREATESAEQRRSRLAHEQRERTRIADQLVGQAQEQRRDQRYSGSYNQPGEYSAGGMEQRQAEILRHQQSLKEDAGRLTTAAAAVTSTAANTSTKVFNLAGNITRGLYAINRIAMHSHGAVGALGNKDFIRMGEHMNAIKGQITQLKQEIKTLPAEARGLKIYLGSVIRRMGSTLTAVKTVMSKKPKEAKA